MSASDALITKVHGQTVLNYTFVSCLAILFYEWAENFTDEVELIWAPKGWSFMKMLYLISRYSPFIDTPLNIIFLIPDVPLPVCKVLYHIACWVALTGMCVSEAIVMIRTHALYGRTRGVFIFLLSVGLTAATLAYICWGLWTSSWEWGPAVAPGVTSSCRVVKESTITFIPFIAMTLYEILIVVMTIRKGFKEFRQTHNRVITQLYSDGILFFTFLMVVSIATIAFDTTSLYWSGFLVKMTRVFHSIIACRILLHLRGAASHPNETSPAGAAAGAFGGGHRAARHAFSKGIVSTLLFRTQLPAASADSERGLTADGSEEYEIAAVASGDTGAELPPMSPHDSDLERAGTLGGAGRQENALAVSRDRRVQWT